jgi:glutamine cyclotransferase
MGNKLSVALWLVLGIGGIGVSIGGCKPCVNQTQTPEGQVTEGQATEGQATEGQATEGQATEGDTEPDCGRDCTYTVVKTYPHDPEAFTQGLVYADGIFYEGTGLNGRSTLRKVEPETGTVIQMRDLSSQLFGEGVAVLNDRVYQLTWVSHVAYVYDKQTFNLIEQFTYTTEGWGLTHDGTNLIMSDGSSTIYYRDPATFNEVRHIQVLDGATAVTQLNELEYIHNQIYANVWQTNTIVRIDPATGTVLGWIHLDGLLTAQERAHADVLNGIAFDPATERLFVTGKLWPKLFEIKLAPNTR